MENAETGRPAEAAARAAEFRALFDDAVRLRRWLQGTLPSVYAFVFARCGADETVAEDITQETMVEVVRHRHNFDGRSHPLTWVCGIARHKVADHYRADFREKRRKLRLLDATPSLGQPASEALELTDAVKEALHRLPEAQRIVLASHYLDGLPVRDIAARLKRSESAVESLLARGRDGFRRAWDDMGGAAT